jgi:hypothetical protein
MSPTPASSVVNSLRAYRSSALLDPGTLYSRIPLGLPSWREAGPPDPKSTCGGGSGRQPPARPTVLTNSIPTTRPSMESPHAQISVQCVLGSALGVRTGVEAPRVGARGRYCRGLGLDRYRVMCGQRQRWTLVCRRPTIGEDPGSDPQAAGGDFRLWSKSEIHTRMMDHGVGDCSGRG